MKKDIKLINTLKPIGNFNTYSRYSESLENIFKNQSLKDLLYTLKNPAKMSEDIEERLYRNDIESYYANRESNKKCLLEYEYEDYLKRQQELFSHQKKKEPWSFNLKTPRLPLTKSNLDFFKYNPNYKVIFKNVPSVTFAKPTKKLLELKDIYKIEKNKNNLFLKKNYKTIETSKTSEYFPILNSVKNESTKSIMNESKKFNNSSYDKNNHSFRFSKYSSRRPVEAKVNNKVTYLEDYDFLTNNRTIDFKKMQKRNENNLINTYTLQNPSMCYYNPKYDCIEIKHAKKISFNPEGFKKTTKFIKNKNLKRILMSYNVNREYATVDNEKLVKPESITKLLNL